jgi:hypothetical protein
MLHDLVELEDLAIQIGGLDRVLVLFLRVRSPQDGVEFVVGDQREYRHRARRQIPQVFHDALRLAQIFGCGRSSPVWH